jgi:hypothetical protein
MDSGIDDEEENVMRNVGIAIGLGIWLSKEML